MNTWIFLHKYRNQKEREAWGHVRCIPILNGEMASKRRRSKPVRRQFGVSVKCTEPLVCKFPKPASGEELINGTRRDQKSEEADFRHLPVICVNFILENQNATAGPGPPCTICNSYRRTNIGN